MEDQESSVVWQAHDAFPLLGVVAGMYSDDAALHVLDFWNRSDASDPHARLADVVNRLKELPVRIIDSDVPITAEAVRVADRIMTFMPGAIEIGAMQIMLMMSALPPSWAPTDRASCEAVFHLSAAVEFGLEGPQSAESIRRKFSSVGGDWVSFGRRLGLDGITHETVDDLVWEIDDMGRDVLERLVRPVLDVEDMIEDHDAVSATALDLISPDCGLPLMAEKSRRWHAVQGRLPGLAAMPPGPWPVLALPWADASGGTVRFLASVEDLREEGVRMCHCVESYGGACARGTSHVASVLISDGEGDEGRRTTLEVRMQHGRPVVRQHRGVENAHPDAAASDLVSMWLAEVVAGRIDIDPAALRTRETEARGWVVPEIGTPADWRGIVQRRLARMGWEELVAEIRTIFARHRETV